MKIDNAVQNNIENELEIVCMAPAEGGFSVGGSSVGMSLADESSDKT